MSENVIQASFAAGELSPSLFARVDFAKYRSGCATMRNFFVDYRSGASTRPGTEFIRPAFGNKVRLVRFQQSTTVTFVLEFGNFYLRFISNGGSVVGPGSGISNVTKGTSTIVTSFIPGFNNGDLVFISGVQGMPEINNRYYTLANSTSSNFEIMDGITGSSVNSTTWGDRIAGGLVQKVFTIPTPYSENELSMLKFSQNAAVMNITHPNHPPHKLTLIDALNWVLAPAIFGATIGPPIITTAAGSGAGPVAYQYVVTSVDSNNQESTQSSIATIAAVQDLRVTAGSNLLIWAAVPGATAYNVYGASPTYGGTLSFSFGFMGSTPATNTSFVDSNIAADFAQSPPIHENPFLGVNPQVSSYFQQRLVYANGGGNLVATFWASKVGAPYNFDVSNPTQANDAITGSLVSLEVNEIKSLIPMPTGLIALTTSGAWQINGGAGGVATQGGPITPTTATATPQAYIGANDVPPIVVNYDILFVQAKGSIVRDLTFNIYANIYTGNDISILSSHLFYGHTIREWAYAEEPFKSIWTVREDGILLSLTLVKEQEMYGWARHDTLGNFMSVATVTEGQFDATYFAVQRPHPTVDRAVVLCIERMADRTFPYGAEDAWCVDCGSKTTNFFPNDTLAISSPVDGFAVFTSFAPLFNADMIGWVIRAGGGKAEVTEFINVQQVKAKIVQPVTDLLPDDPLHRFDQMPPGTWSLDKPFTKVFGLDHLQGQKISVLADGGVVNDLVVDPSDGSITLPAPATKVIAGYGYQAQLQTMYLDLGNETNTAQGKRKKVSALTVRVKDSRGLKAGMTFNTITPLKEQNRVTVMGAPIPLITDDERIIMDPLWDIPGQICLQMDDPLPSTILGVIPEVTMGDTQK